MEQCDICKKIFKNLKYHTWRMHGEGRKHNPNKDRVAWNKGLSKLTDVRVLRNSESLSKTWKPKGAVLLSSEQLSLKAKKQGFGGYRENAGRSKKVSVFNEGKKITLQSSYENAVYEILCELGIQWERPKALKYDGRNYFADFYLPEYNLWLDPKNDFKAKQDEEKIRKVVEQNGVKLFVLTKEKICSRYIRWLIYGRL